MADPKERRQQKRYKQIIQLDCSGAHFLQSRKSCDISLSGIFIETDMLEEIGVILEIKFLFKEDWRVLTVTGEVMWVSNKKYGKGMGIRFIDSPKIFLKRIKKLYLDPSFRGIPLKNYN